jgi:outer membrane biosynthesis protein TonB
MPADPIYEVALVQWPEPNFQPPTPTRTPPKVEPKPVEPEKPKPEPRPQEVVIPEKVEATPKPVEKKPPPEPKVEATPKPVETPQVPTEPVSLGQVDQRDFKHDYYLQLLRGILARAWEPPSEGEGLRKTSLHFIIQRDGTIVAPEIIAESGWTLFDRAALRAVLSVKKLPPLPEAYTGNELGLTVDFQTMMGAP